MFNYIVHIECEGRYLGITGRKKAEGQLIYSLKMWHDSCISERYRQIKTALKNVMPATILCSRLSSKNIKIKIYRTIILALVLYGCETCCFILTLVQDEGVRKGAEEAIWA